MSEETNEKCDTLHGIEEDYRGNSNETDKIVVSKDRKDFNIVETSNAENEEGVKCDSSSADPEVLTSNSKLQAGGTIDGNDTKKHKRRGGRTRRGISQQKDVKFGRFISEKMWQKRRWSQKNKVPYYYMKQAINVAGTRNRGLSRKLPDGILFKEDRNYVGYHCAFCNCTLNSFPTMKDHVAGFRHRTNIRASYPWEWKTKREANTTKSVSEKSARDVALLSSLPDGILLVEDRSYVGYHCTYCNCALNHFATIKDHVAGFRHKLIIDARRCVEEQKMTEANAVESETGPETLKTEDNKIEAGPEALKSQDDKIEAGPETVKNEDNKMEAGPETLKSKDDKIEAGPEIVKNEDDKIEAGPERLRSEDDKIESGKSEETDGLPSGDSTCKASIPLKSSLQDALAAASEPVIGLDYVTEKQRQGEVSLFECNLCGVISEVDDMKAHVLGTRHRLMYMKKTDPQKIAELMAKNLPKVERNKEIRACIESLMGKYGKGTVTVEICNTSLTREVQRKGNQESSDKLRKRASRRKRINEGEISSRKRRPHDNFNPVMPVRGRDKYAYGDSYHLDQHSYDRQSYASDKGRSLKPLSPSRQSKEGVANDPSKLPDINVTNEEEAEVVMNVINSLTERFLQYKLKEVAGPSREILEKSLKGENLLNALSLLTDESTERNINKPSSLPEDKVAQPHTSYKETADIVAPVKSKIEKTYQDERRGSRYSPYSRNDWAEPVEASSKDIRNNSRYLAESMKIRSKDTIDQSRYSWNETKKKAVDSVIQPLYRLDKIRDGGPVNRMNQFPSWSKKGRYGEDSWNETRDIGADRSITSHQKQGWSSSVYGKDTVDWIRERSDQVSSWDEKERYRDVEDTWSDIRNIGYDRGIADQQRKDDWSDRDGKNSISQSKYDWNQAGNTTYFRNVNKPNWELNLEKSKNTIDHLKYDTRKSLPSRSDSLYVSPQYDGSKRNPNPSSLFTHNWNEQRQSSNIGNANIDLFPKTAYHLDEFDDIPSSRSISASSFGRQQKSWSADGKSRAQEIWNRTDQYRAKGMNDRSLDYSVGRNSIYGRGSGSSFTSQLLRTQSNTSSLSQRNFSRSTIVDGSFDKYGKKLQAEKSRNSLTAMGSGNRSFSTSATRSHYQGFSTSSFNRPSISGLLPSVTSYSQLK